MRVKVLDTTLRDGEQTPGVSLSPEEKLRIAIALDDLGVDVIEAGSAITSEGEREGIKLVAEQGLKAEVSTYCRILEKDIDAALSCGVDSVFLVAPTSELHVKYKLGISREKLLENTLKAVEYCKDHGLLVDLCTEDGSRTDLKFLERVLFEAHEHGISRFTLADTVGIMVPERMSEIFKALSGKTKTLLGVHCHDDLGLATANTLAAVASGAGMVDVTINGLGERAGNAPLEEVVLALDMGYGYKTGIKTERIAGVSRLVERLSGIPVCANKAIVGGNAFTHEAGIHVDGILKNPETYEAIKPESVGFARTFVLGKHVGIKAVKSMLDDLRIDVSEEQLKEVLRQVKFMGDKGKKVTNVDLATIADSVKGVDTKRVIDLAELVAVAGNRFTPTASVKIIINGKEIVESATGTGPVDAAVKAIKNATEEIPFDLIEYHVDSISGGTDALVKVMVKLKSKDKIITAQGAGSDIILASVDALVNGLNLIAQRIA